MFISKKRWQALIKRIADLEVQVQGQQKQVSISLDFPNCNTDDLINKHHQIRNAVGIACM
ncbi:MAG: hypothetical protein K0R34_2470 [Herbinix sp.]|jgi:hypothetical protein|nr:hypothetical protein [Herbinix sp.]